MIIENAQVLTRIEWLILIIWAVTLLVILAVHYILIHRERKMMDHIKADINNSVRAFDMILGQFENGLIEIAKNDPIENALLTQIAKKL